MIVDKINNKKPMLSIVVPVYNEGESVYEAHERISAVLSNIKETYDYEFLFIEDGSDDDSFLHLTKLCAMDEKVVVIRLLTNSGSHMAIRAGLDNVNGDMVCFLACDLQDPPELIPELLLALKDSIQIVWAVRNTRKDSPISQLTAKLFYSLARIFVSKNIPVSGSSMFLLNSSVLKTIRLYKERNLTLEGFFAINRFKSAFVYYDRQSRKTGKSKWTLGKKIKLFVDFFVGYSYLPIRLISYLGFVFSLLGFLYTLLIIYNAFCGKPPQGWASLMIAILVIGGLQMLMMGVLGEYLWRALDETRRRPPYIIESIVNSPVARTEKKIG